jgi:hypothetical protein
MNILDTLLVYLFEFDFELISKSNSNKYKLSERFKFFRQYWMNLTKIT